jgi:hypothetical protein
MNIRDLRTVKRLADIEAATAFPLSQKEIAAACFINECCTGKYLRILIADRCMHIAAWRETAIGRKVALYVWGAGRNATKPKPRTRVVIERLRIKRIKADPEAYDRFLSMHRARYAAKRAVMRPASWLSALGAI